jgi:hypothetical protein
VTSKPKPITLGILDSINSCTGATPLPRRRNRKHLLYSLVGWGLVAGLALLMLQAAR